MKFGKLLQQSLQVLPSAWEPYWVDYKALKKLIKGCARMQAEDKLRNSNLGRTRARPVAKEDNDSIRDSHEEQEFFKALRAEVKKVSDFFVKEQAQCAARVGQMDDEYQRQQSTDTSTEAHAVVLRHCVSLYKELLLLENFAVMNFCAISKILKKHDKWTGYATRHKFMSTILTKQPFATYVPLLRMIGRLERIYVQSTGFNIENHEDRHQHASDLEKHLPPHTTTSVSSSERQEEVPPQTPPRPPRPSREHSPESDASVTLTRVQSLRDGAQQLRQMEGLDEYEETEDDRGESDTAARAMLSMREGGHKRKARSPLSSDGKRKMSFATILN